MNKVRGRRINSITHLEVSTANKQVNYNALRLHNMGQGIVDRFKLSMSTTFDCNLNAVF